MARSVPHPREPARSIDQRHSRPLLSIAEDPKGDRLGRLGAIQALGALGPSAGSTPPRLKAIAASDPESFGEADADYTEWMKCLEEHRPVAWALPLGRLQSPRVGWLIIRGRRGHYQFCDEVRAHDLETAQPNVAQSCSRLHRQRGGRDPVPRRETRGPTIWRICNSRLPTRSAGSRFRPTVRWLVPSSATVVDPGPLSVVPHRCLRRRRQAAAALRPVARRALGVRRPLRAQPSSGQADE